jgi:hypothetical protein
MSYVRFLAVITGLTLLAQGAARAGDVPLVGLLINTVQKYRESVSRAQCASNLKLFFTKGAGIGQDNSMPGVPSQAYVVDLATKVVLQFSQPGGANPGMTASSVLSNYSQNQGVVIGTYNPVTMKGRDMYRWDGVNQPVTLVSPGTQVESSGGPMSIADTNFIYPALFLGLPAPSLSAWLENSGTALLSSRS